MTPDWDEDWDVYDMTSCLFDTDGEGPCGRPAVVHFLYPKEGYFANLGIQDRVATLCSEHLKSSKAVEDGAVSITLDELAVMRINIGPLTMTCNEIIVIKTMGS